MLRLNQHARALDHGRTRSHKNRNVAASARTSPGKASPAGFGATAARGSAAARWVSMKFRAACVCENASPGPEPTHNRPSAVPVDASSRRLNAVPCDINCFCSAELEERGTKVKDGEKRWVGCREGEEGDNTDENIMRASPRAQDPMSRVCECVAWARAHTQQAKRRAR